jgi:hypothetical protein
MAGSIRPPINSGGLIEKAKESKMLNFEFGKILIVIGSLIIFIGILLMTVGKIPFIGRLPGDIHIQKENFSFYFPITTSIIASIILSLIFWLFSKR